MSNTTEALRCPNCGAGLSFDPEKQNFHCEFCLSDFTEPELREAGAFDDVRDERGRRSREAVACFIGK